MIVGCPCPAPEDIGKLHRCALDPQRERRMERHLADCPDCLGRLVAMDQREGLPTISDYHLVSEVGRGRFGVVYKAWWLTDQPRLVALKLLAFKGEIERGRFEREIKVLRQIDSPYVVKCLEAGWAGDTPFHVMELIDGVHLDEHLLNSTNTLYEKLVILERVCRAVADAHDHNVVHRDLKPKNILVDSDGNPHVLDFGICGVESDSWGSSVGDEFTHIGDIIGTLRYMSPEQAWGGCCGSIGKHSDIWSLGIMLYEIVTDGGYPYEMGATQEKSSQEALLERIRKEMPHLPSLAHLERSTELETLLSRCLTWEVDHRLASAEQLADDIQRYRTGVRIRTKRPSLRYRFSRVATGLATQARWAAMWALVACVGIAIWILPALLDVRWQATGHAYAQPDSWTQDAPSLPADSRDRVLVVGVYDHTVNDVIRYAWENHLPGVTAQINTWRGVHGRLMERLATASPTAVVWDYYFRSLKPADDAFVVGVQELEANGVPVVLASRSYRANGSPFISPNIATALGDRLRHGAIFARDMVERQGEFVLALQHRPPIVIPGIAMTTLAAVLHPQCMLELDWGRHDGGLSMLYKTRSGDYLRERDFIDLTKVTKLPKGGSLAGANGTQCIGAFPLARPSQWEKRTTSYGELLSASSADLHALAADRVIIIGDFRRESVLPKPDLHWVRFGPGQIEEVAGVYLLADAISGLLANRYYKAAFPTKSATFFLMMLFAVVGCLLPIGLTGMRFFEKQWQRQALYASLVAMITLCGLVMAGSRSFAAIHLGMAGLAFTLPLLGCFWIEFTRHRYRLADRELQAVRGFQFDSGGTVTMPGPAMTSLTAMSEPQ